MNTVIKQAVGGYNPNPFSAQMTRLKFDFASCTEHRDRVVMATALSGWLKAMEAIGILEHTGDWDPILRIRFRNGESVETHSGYFRIKDADFEGDLLIDAPDQEELKEWEEEEQNAPIMKFYDRNHKAYRIPLNMIARISIDPQ